MRSIQSSEEISGLAGGCDDVVNNPLRLISRPLYLPPENRTKIARASWERGWEPIDPQGFYRADKDEQGLSLEYYEFPGQDEAGLDGSYQEKILKSQRAFVVGGVDYISWMGLIQTWYQNQENRDDAVRNMLERNWAPYLEALRDKENNPGDIFGKNSIPKYFQTLPQLMNRPNDPRMNRRGELRVDLTLREVWSEHQLRIRKVIEFIALTEAVTAWRFAHNEGLNRFRDFVDEETPVYDAKRVLDILWIEPVIYTIWPGIRAPRNMEAAKILQSETLRQLYVEMSGSKDPRGLYWLLLGGPGRLKSVQATAEVCNQFYGENVTPCRAITIPPRDYNYSRAPMEKPSYEKEAPRQYRNSAEDIRTYCRDQVL